MLNESLTMIANLALVLFVMTSLMAEHLTLKVKPIELVTGPLYGRYLKPGQSNCGQHGD